MTHYRRRRLGLLLLLLFAGCHNAPDYKTAPVSGKVTMDNKPLAGATVTFTPLDAKPEAGKPVLSSTGHTDEQGNYSLKLDADGREGAVPGQYRVRIAKMDRGGEGKPGKGQVVPHAYNQDSTLQFNVPDAGSKEANFSLSGNPSSAPPRRGRGGS